MLIFAIVKFEQNWSSSCGDLAQAQKKCYSDGLKGQLQYTLNT